MTISVVQHKVAGTGQTTANTLAITVNSTAAGNLLVVLTAAYIHADAPHVVSSVGDGTNNFLHVTGADSSNVNGGRTDAFYWPSSDAGKTTITVVFGTVGALGYYKSGWVWEVSGIASPVVDAANSGSSAADNVTRTGVAVTTGATAGFAAGAAVCHNCTVNPKSGNEFSAGGDIDSNTGNAGCSLIYSTAASHQPAWSDDTTVQYGTTTVSFKSGGAVNSGFFALFMEAVNLIRKRRFRKSAGGIFVPSYYSLTLR
jgi:hypothetical protein